MRGDAFAVGMSDVVSEALERVTLADVWDLAAAFGFGRSVPTRDGVLESPFREDGKKPGFSISKDLRLWKDFGTGEGGNSWTFVEKCRPEWSKAEVAKCIVDRVMGAGAWEASREKRTLTAAEKREWRLQKQRKEREEMVARRKKREADLRRLGAALLMDCPDCVRSRWQEASEPGEERLAKLAKKRGWPFDWAGFAAEAGWLRFPVDQFGEQGRGKRFVAFPVEVVLKDVSRHFFGYHQQFFVPPKDGGDEGRKGWTFFPHRPKVVRTVYQRALLAAADGEGIREGDQWCPPVPFVLGNPWKADLWILTEGQWDALTFWGALGLFDEIPDLPFSVAIFGIRGVQGVSAFMDHYARGLKNRGVFMVGDSDEAGKSWYGIRQKNPSFRERLEIYGAKVEVRILKGPWGKDFNDYYRAKSPSREEMIQAVYDLGLVNEEVTV